MKLGRLATLTLACLLGTQVALGQTETSEQEPKPDNESPTSSTSSLGPTDFVHGAMRPLRLALNTEAGAQTGNYRAEHGRRRAEGPEMHFGFRLDGVYTPRATPLGVVGLARFGIWQSEWSRSRDESRSRYDFAVGPAFRKGNGRVSWHLAAPVGLSVAGIESGPGRAVRERYSKGYGVNFGLLGGLDFVWNRSYGFCAGAGLTSHVVWVDRNVVVASSGARFTESLRYTDVVADFSLGFVLWF